MTTTPKKRGGPRPNSGRPKKDESDKVVKCKISMTHEHHAATDGERSGIVRRALDLYLWYKTKILDTTTGEEGYSAGLKYNNGSFEFYQDKEKTVSILSLKHNLKNERLF